MKLLNYLLVLCATASAVAFAPAPANKIRSSGGQVAFMVPPHLNLLDTLGSMFSNFGKQAKASHILIGPKTMGEEEAKAKLTEIKAAVNDDPAKFAEYASQFSTCPSAKKGGDLGSFGPGMMVRDFDKICFNEAVGVVHGPVSTQFGEHLILITERTGDD
jgi:peptidyl-prolyl cis-trans isomerase C